MAEIRELDFINRRHKSLFAEFDRVKPQLKEIRDYINPDLGFFEEDTPNQERDDTEIINSAGIYWSNVQASGMQWGITPPSQQWFKFTLPVAELMNSDRVCAWLDELKNRTLDVMARSNFYPSNHQNYLEHGVMGTGAMLIEEDDENVIHCRPFTAGEFAFGTDKRGRPNAFARLMKMTTYQIVEQFGLENVPETVRGQYNAGNYDGYHDVKHLICPNRAHDPNKIDNQSMKFSDYYWMDGQKDGEYLQKSGFNEFPVMVARGDVVGPNIYGRSSGHRALADSKSIQLMEKDILTAVELAIKPPIQAPYDVMKSGGINMLPAGANFYNPMGGSDSAIRPVFQVNLDIDHAQAKADKIEAAIKRHFNGDMWLMISDLEKGTRSATEVLEMAAEKMSQQGPQLSRLQTSYLPQIIDRVTAIGWRKGIYPPPPPELADYQDMPIKVEYESILQQAQNRHLVAPIVDTVGKVIEMATSTQKVEILDTVNWDETVKQIALNNGPPPSIMNSKETIAMIRQARAQQAQTQQMTEMAMAASQGAKNLAGADMSGDNMLSRMAGKQ